MNVSWGAAALAGLGIGQAELKAHVELQQVKIRVALLSPPTALPTVLAEVERRREFMQERAAYESVGDDLQCGRWEA